MKQKSLKKNAIYDKKGMNYLFLNFHIFFQILPSKLISLICQKNIMSDDDDEIKKPHDDYAVYDESSCRGHGKRTGLGFLSKQINKKGSSIKSSQILTKTKLIGKDNIKKNSENNENFGSETAKNKEKYHDEDSKTGMVGKKKEVLNLKMERKKKGKKK